MPNSPVPVSPILKKPSIMIQPPPSQVTEIEPIAKATEVPEPAIKVEDIPRPSQEDLAALSIDQQTIRKRNEMVPGTETPPYKFTDSDRKLALEARRFKEYDWEEANIDAALIYLAEIRAECERGGIILSKRVSELKVERVKCFGCDNIINLSEGRWATMRTRNNFETGIPESAYACSAACGLKLNREFSHPTRNAAIPVERPPLEG